MRYFIIAGEQSGDLHGSNLIKELFTADKSAEIFCWGGDLMESAGAKLLIHDPGKFAYLDGGGPGGAIFELMKRGDWEERRF